MYLYTRLDPTKKLKYGINYAAENWLQLDYTKLLEFCWVRRASAEHVMKMQNYCNATFYMQSYFTANSIIAPTEPGEREIYDKDTMTEHLSSEQQGTRVNDLFI